MEGSEMSQATIWHRMIKRTFVVVWVIVITAGAVRADEPPNFILLMGDDHGWDEVAYNGHAHLRTPVLDKMAAHRYQQIEMFR